MNKRVINVFSIIICCVFIFTLGTTVISLYSDYKTGLEAAEKRFEKLSSQTTEASDAFSYDSREFISLFNNSVGSPSIYKSINLEVDGKSLYVFPAEPNQASTFMVKTFSRRITSSSGANISLTCGIYTLTPQNIYYRLKIAFIIILCGTLLTGIMILYLYLSSDATETKENKVKEDDLDFDSSFDSLEDTSLDETDDSVSGESIASDDETKKDDSDSKDEGTEDDKIDYYPMESAYTEHSEHEKTDEDAALVKEPETVNASEDVIEAEEEKTAASEPVEDKEENEETAETAISVTEEDKEVSSEGSEDETNESEENGLFSPESGFGYESYMMSRLDNELVRSASSEQELSLMLIRIPGMTKTASYYPKICKVLSDVFVYKDLIFEYETDGFAIIIQNKDVDKSMETAETLYAELNTILTTSGELSKPLIGISSRSLRLVSAERLKTEAVQAIKHADEDKDSPIVAFRVNPEKYRHYIQNN